MRALLWVLPALLVTAAVSAQQQAGVSAGGESSTISPIRQVLKQAADVQSRDPFAAVSLLEGAFNRSTSADADFKALTEKLAEAYAVVRWYDHAIAARQRVVELAKPGGSEELLARVALIEALNALGNYSQALAQVEAARSLMRGASTPAGQAGLARVEAAVLECSGDTLKSLALFWHSLDGGPATHHRDPPTSFPPDPATGKLLASPKDRQLAKDYLQLLWRVEAEYVAQLAQLKAQSKAGDRGSSRDKGSNSRLVRDGLRKRLAAIRQVVNRTAAALVASGPWERANQIPKHYVPALPDRAWHDTAAEFPLLAPVEDALRAAHGALVQEYRQLAAAGRMLREAECIHDASSGLWTYYTVNGHWNQEQDADGCSTHSPVACSLLRNLTALGRQLEAQQAAAGLPPSQRQHLRVLRGGYSAVHGASYLRPHCGLTNTQLKFHLGLIIPYHPVEAMTQDGSEQQEVQQAQPQPCASITVAGETRSWEAGGTLFFDDSYLHSVRHTCKAVDGRAPEDLLRVVFQLVISRPDLPDPGAGAAAGH